MRLEFRRLMDDARLPAHARPGDAGLDLTAAIDVPGLNNRVLDVFDESRQVQSKGDSFTDTFDPLQVHIYIARPELGATTVSPASATLRE